MGLPLPAMEKKIRSLAKAYYPQVRKWRRHLHKNPELSFKEYETSKYVCGVLDELGITYSTGWCKTGIVGIIKGQKKGKKKTIALRADMDALPITEANKVPYKSQNEGVMHACGHDVHTSSLLGAAAILNELRDSFGGQVKLIFQPGEELLPGGASVMIKEGVLKNPAPDLIIGQHVHPPLAVGKVGFKGGMYMASADEIYVEVKGKGGHAALPQGCIDPILIASQLVVSLQQIVSRRADPKIPTVLSFGKINSVGGATNIIPDVVKLEGTFRTFDETWRTEAHKIMKKTATELAKSYGGQCKFKIAKGYPFLLNDDEVTGTMQGMARKYMGESKVVDLPQRMTAEDFAYYSHEIPACFFRLGTGNATKGIQSPVHTSTFDIDENALKTGMGLMAYLAISQL